MTYSNGSDNNGFDGNPPTVLLPYQEWIEDAYRHVVRNALKYAEENGLPGNHNFYLTFDTSYPGVSVPSRIKEKYPNEMTIVLQHQYRDLVVDLQAKKMSVVLSFGGVASTLVIPFKAISAFSDPEAKLLLTFTVVPPTASLVEELTFGENITPITNETSTDTKKVSDHIHKEETQVVSLDAFRKKND